MIIIIIIKLDSASIFRTETSSTGGEQIGFYPLAPFYQKTEAGSKFQNVVVL
jgi:hypothetical protein